MIKFTFDVKIYKTAGNYRDEVYEIFADSQRLARRIAFEEWRQNGWWVKSISLQRVNDVPVIK